MTNFKIKSFKFIFHPSWSEEETLGKFRYKVKQDETLFSNNHLNSNKPIRMVKSFFELNQYIQSFNFPDLQYPLYFSLALALMASYKNNKNIDYAISFTAFWKVSTDTNNYIGKYQLPIENIVYYTKKLVPKSEFSPKFINSNNITTSSFINEEKIFIKNLEFYNLNELVNNLKQQYFFDSNTYTFFEYQKEFSLLWSPIQETQIFSEILKFYNADIIAAEKASQILSYVKYHLMSDKSSTNLCKMNSKIFDLSEHNDVTKSVTKNDLLVFYTPNTIIKVDYNNFATQYRYLLD